MREFSKFELAAIKRTAQNVNPMVSKKNRIEAEINKLQAEWEELDKVQETFEASIRTMTGGYSTEDLVDKVVEETGSLDKKGNPIKVTKYVFKYPDTIIPPVLEDANPEEVDGEAKVAEVEEVPSEEGSFDPTFGMAQ